MEFLKDPIRTPHANLDEEYCIEDYAFHLVLKEVSFDDDVYLDDDILATVMDVEEESGLISYGEFPF